MKYLISEKASEELLSLFVDGILNFGSEQASRYQTQLISLFELLSQHPFMGTQYDHENETIRRFPHGPHIIFYEILDDSVLILSIIDARSDY